MKNISKIAKDINLWTFAEANSLLKRIGNKTPEKGYVLFETGYGPSGLPHIGTFGEVSRTTMVKNAFEAIAPEIPTKLFCVSDDMDGLRKVPDNVPNKEMLEGHLGKPLTAIPDPFGTDESYGHHMNRVLREFLDHFGFEYEFKSATECYKNGAYDEKLLLALERFDKIMKVMLPSLGEERQKTYSPFMPICQKTGKVLQVPTIETKPKEGTIIYKDEDGSLCESKVTGGHCKLQWKPDLGMRWAALDVDYEMYGKDHLASGKLYSAICSILGGKPPQQYHYELFLDEKGEKISKSKGNGISMDEWLRYAPAESLSYYNFINPRKAKRLYFDVIPKAVDEYLTHLGKYEEQDDADKLKNPVWHVHNGKPPKNEAPLSFALLLNLASACHAKSADILWGFINNYDKNANKENSAHLDELVKHALHYYEDFVEPNKKYRKASEQEKAALIELSALLKEIDEDTSSEDLQTELFTIAKKHNFEPLRNWFTALYEVLLGQSQGPRFGSFIALYGTKQTAKLIDEMV